MSSAHELTFPLKNPNDLDGLQLGDTVHINGIIVTSRDMAHKYYVEKITEDKSLMKSLSPYLKNGAIYHCGPIVRAEDRQILSAGPTTSIREEPYQDKVIELFGLSAVIGKGGMGKKTLNGLEKGHSLYLHGIGGAGSYYASCLKVKEVFKLDDFGMPEAIWVLEAKNFPAIVTMDFRGNSLHQDIELRSSELLQKLINENQL